ncbi:hypothetical protein GCM10010471_11620 [Leucobacter komagatae]|nr:hypothetical protein [Leucobacter komagatae]
MAPRDGTLMHDFDFYLGAPFSEHMCDRFQPIRWVNLGPREHVSLVSAPALRCLTVAIEPEETPLINNDAEMLGANLPVSEAAQRCGVQRHRLMRDVHEPPCRVFTHAVSSRHFEPQRSLSQGTVWRRWPTNRAAGTLDDAAQRPCLGRLSSPYRQHGLVKLREVFAVLREAPLLGRAGALRGSIGCTTRAYLSPLSAEVKFVRR